MKRRKYALSLLSVSSVFFSGCNFGGDEENITKTMEPTVEKRETDSATAGGSISEQTADTQEFDADTDTDSVVLRLSDLPNTFEYSGEQNILTTELDADERDQYAAKNIIRQHSRSFQRSGESDGAMLVYSEATVYESVGDAEAQLTETESKFRDQSAEIDAVELATGVTATQIKYENDRDNRNILLYYLRSNMQLLVIASGSEEFYPELAEDLMVDMILDAK